MNWAFADILLILAAQRSGLWEPIATTAFFILGAWAGSTDNPEALVKTKGRKSAQTDLPGGRAVRLRRTWPDRQ